MSADPRLPELFEQAAGLAPEARAIWLAELRARAPELAREIEELLAAAPRGERLDTPAWQRLELGDEPATTAPERIGPYRILREIGRGGMGRVFLAEQEAEGFRRRVALKLLDRPALTEDDVRRFRDEVRILATLEHPGIARFLDGGRAADGAWFLALEYVEGVDLIEHASSNGLAIRERIELFLAVLEAVESAHAHSVVHRDLKPGNILVGRDGRPRLLDFGISKLVDPETGDAATLTRTETRALTPAYASPEQFRGERATTASDVYSLGVVLYELLAGRRPFGDATSSRAELERAVLEQEPEAPSTAARKLAAGSAPADPPTGRPARTRLGRELDAVCLKALRKAPRERYASVAAFAGDLRRYLEGRPVEALRGDLRYRAAKLLRRRRAEVATAAALALAVLAIAFALRVLHSGRTVEATPGTELRPFPIPPAGTASTEELEAAFAAAPGDLAIGAELVSALAREGRTQEAAVVVGRLRQLPGGDTDPLVDHVEAIIATNLDEPQRALALSTRGLASALATGRGELVARLRSARARTLSDLGRREEAVAEFEVAAREAERAGDQASLARILNDLAIEKLTVGELAAGERLLERALAATRAISDSTRAGSITHNLAGLAFLRGDLALAEQRYREAIGIYDALGRARRAAVSRSDLALTLRELGRPDEVSAPLDEAIAQLAELGDHTSLAYALFYRADFAIDRGELDGIETAAREIEAEARTSGNRVSLAFAELLRGRGAAARGELADARARLGEAVRIFTANGDSDLAAAASLTAAEVALEADDGAAATALVEQALAGFRSAGDTDFAFHAATLLARVDARAGRLAEAQRRLAALGPGAERRANVRLRLRYRAARAASARLAGDPGGARAQLGPAIEEAIAARRKLDELSLRLDRVEVDLGSGDGAPAREAAGAIAEEARALGLAGLEARARARVAAATSEAAAAKRPAPGAAALNGP